MNLEIMKKVDKYCDNKAVAVVFDKLSETGKGKLKKAFYVISLIANGDYSHGGVDDMVDRFDKYIDYIFEFIGSGNKTLELFYVLTSKSTMKTVVYLLGMAEAVDYFVKRSNKV